MGSGSTPSGGASEKDALLKDINAASDLLPDERNAILARAQGIQTDQFTRGGPTGNSIIGSLSLESVNKVRGEFNEAMKKRQAVLLERRQKLATQLETLKAAPGSKQTTNLTALVPNSGSGIVSLV